MAPTTSQPAPPIDLVTIGETLALFQPMHEGSLAYAPLFTRSCAGAESNVAIGLQRLGKKTRWISRLGADPFGDVVAAMLAGEGVDLSAVVRDPLAPTAIFFREFKAFHDPVVYYYRKGSAASLLTPGDLQPRWFQGARFFHFTGITPALGPETAPTVAAAAQMAREMGLLVSFDPNLRRKLWDEERARRSLLDLIPLCDIFLPGVEEAEFLLGRDSLAAYGARFLAMGPRVVAIKRGAAGSCGFVGDSALDVAPYPVAQVVDTIGAGDAFAAGVLSVLMDGPPGDLESPDRLAAALERGSLMGALATQFRGDWEGLPTLAEMEQILGQSQRVTR